MASTLRLLAAPRPRGLLDGTLLVAVWVALWTFFALGVLHPAATLERGVPVAERRA